MNLILESLKKNNGTQHVFVRTSVEATLVVYFALPEFFFLKKK